MVLIICYLLFTIHGWGEEYVRADYIHMYRNGGSIPPRTPDLSKILKALQTDTVKFTVVALSYRGYWKSKGRASERGIKLDAAAALAWVTGRYPTATLVLWGQSIGAGVATTAAEAYPRGSAERHNIAALILETPFTSVKDMLTALYPQKWLPYRYLYPFLRSQWDSREALHRISQSTDQPRVLILAGEQDEVVPRDHASELEDLCRASTIDVQRVVVPGALHHEILIKPQGRKAIIEFLRSFAVRGGN